MSRFSTFVEEAEDPLPKILPLCYVTEAMVGVSMVHLGEIHPTLCQHAQRELIYCAYGKTSYRTRRKAPQKLGSYLPMAFIMECNVPEESLLGLYPFDTRALRDGCFKGYFHHEMDIDGFALETMPTSARRFVKRFFGANEAYLLDTPVQAIDYPATNFYVESLFKLIQSTHRDKSDECRAAIELQLTKRIKFAETRFLAVVVPITFLDDIGFVKEVERICGVIPTPYIPKHESSNHWYEALEATSAEIVLSSVSPW